MSARIRWFVLGLGLVVSLSLLAEDVFAQRGKGGGRGGGGGGGVSRGGGGGGRSSGRSGGASRSFGRSSSGRSSFGRSGGSRSIGRGGGSLRSFGRSGSGRRSIGGSARSLRGFNGGRNFSSSPRIGQESARGFGRAEIPKGRGNSAGRSGSFFDQGRRIQQGNARRQSSERIVERRRRNDLGNASPAFQGRRNDRSQRGFEGRREGQFDGRRGEFRRGDDGPRDRGDGFRFDRGDRGRFSDRHDFDHKKDDRHDHHRHHKFRRGRSFAGRFLRFHHRPYRSFGIYLGLPYYYDYGYGYGAGGYYDPYYFDYRSDYYLDSYLGLDCYHFSYDPTLVYPAPTEYSAVVPDPSIPIDDEKQFSGDELLALGEDAFYARDYRQAVRWLRHAAIELPDDPRVLMLLSQSLFAVGEYGEAAGAAQAGMLVAENADGWDVIIGNYREYYSDTQDYVDQLKALENHVFKEHPDDQAARFLVGIQYGLLGYPKQSVRELDILLEKAPEDRLAREFRQRMAAQLDPSPPAPEPAGPEALSEPGEKSGNAVPPSEPETDAGQESPPPTVPDGQTGSDPPLPLLPDVDGATTP